MVVIGSWTTAGALTLTTDPLTRTDAGPEGSGGDVFIVGG